MTDLKTELVKHVPNLWKYGKSLCPHEEDASKLLYDTIETALHKQWKKPQGLTTYAWLSQIMYRQFLDDYFGYAQTRRDASSTYRKSFLAPDIHLALRNQSEPVSVH